MPHSLSILKSAFALSAPFAVKLTFTFNLTFTFGLTTDPQLAVILQHRLSIMGLNYDHRTTLGKDTFAFTAFSHNASTHYSIIKLTHFCSGLQPRFIIGQ